MSTDATWRPGLPAPVSRLMLWLLTIELIVRGSDYLPGDPPGVTASLTIVERALPLPVWGVLCLGAGAAVAVGIVLRRSVLICYAAVWAAGIYAALAWGLLLRMIERGAPWAGWRTPNHFLVMAALWACIAAGTWWRGHLDANAGKETHGRHLDGQSA